MAKYTSPVYPALAVYLPDGRYLKASGGAFEIEDADAEEFEKFVASRPHYKIEKVKPEKPDKEEKERNENAATPAEPAKPAEPGEQKAEPATPAEPAKGRGKSDDKADK